MKPMEKLIWDLLGGFSIKLLMYILFCLYLIFFQNKLLLFLFIVKEIVFGGSMGKVTMYIQDKQGRSLALKS